MTREEAWIPVSRELPEEGGHYLVSVKNEYIGEYVSTDDYYSYGFDDWKDEVIAWMPLPEPYDETKDHRSDKCTDYDYCEYCGYASVCENCKA